METAERPRGREAERPSQIPVLGWRDVFLRVYRGVNANRASLMAGGVAYFAVFALIPGLAALVALYGLVADPVEAGRGIHDLAALPLEVRTLIADQIEALTSTPESLLSWGMLGGLVSAVYLASRGMSSLLITLNLVYHETDRPSLLARKLAGIGFTLGAVLLALTSFAVAVALPLVLVNLPLGPAASLLLGAVPWMVLAAGFMGGLMLLYRFGPYRRCARWRWVVPGAVVATLLWLAVSFGFSFYVSRLSWYHQIYGPIGTVVVLLLWFYLTAYIIIVGAELNAQIEHQTGCDSTSGPPRPLGERGAYVADTIGEVPQRPAWATRVRARIERAGLAPRRET